MTQQEQEFKELQEHIQYYKSKYGTVENLSDGCHTYNELYEHRCRLFMELCRQSPNDVYCVEKLKDDEWFLLVMIDTLAKKNKQLSYHLPAIHYEECLEFSDLLAQEVWEKMYDGHTSEDVLERLKNL